MKLNLGAGPQRLTGYLSVDVRDRADVHHDLALTPWPFAAASADELVASHVLEHLDQEQGRAFLAECARLLVPGGLLHLAVPDLDKFIACRLSGDFAPLAGYKWTDLNYLCGGDNSEADPYQRHRHAYSFGSLAWELQGLGFRRITRRAAPAPFDNAVYAAISLYVDAVR